MKKMLALTLVLVAASTVNAQLNLFYDVRSVDDFTVPNAIDNPAGTPYVNSASLATYAPYGIGQNYLLQSGGARGDGQMIWVSPKITDVTDYTGFGGPDLQDEHLYSWDANLDYSKGAFYLYGQFIAGGNEVVSSIGVDQNIPAAAVVDNDLNFYLLGATTTIENATLWDGYNFSGSNASTSLKMVQVPVIPGTPNPTYDATAGLHGTQKLAKVAIEGAFKEGAVNNTAYAQYDLFLAQNSLLITQVAYPGPAGALVYNFGYAGGSPEDGTANLTADMVIIEVRKGDFDLDGAAATGIDDLAYYDIASFYNGTNVNPYELYLGDFDGDGAPCSGIDDGEYYKHANVP
jgi:hypothetical protein